mgnify:CR=1 FL=1
MIDLNHIARYRENNRIEAKKAAGGFPHSLWETYSAFANTIGGLLLLGVEEDRDKTLHITGVPDGPGYAAQFWATVQDPAKVSANILTPEDVALHTVEGKQILVISVPRADRHQRPVYIGDSPFTGAYRRDGEGDYHCSPEEVRAMLRDREDAPADLAVLEGRTPADLSQTDLRQFRALMAMRQPDHPWNYLPDPQFLPAAGILGPGQDGGNHPTLAGLLLLGKRKPLREVFPQFRLTYQEADTGFSLSTLRPGPPENLFSFYGMVTRRLTAVSALLAQDSTLTIAVSGQDEAQCQDLLTQAQHCTAGQENAHCFSASSQEHDEAHQDGLTLGKYRAYLALHDLDPTVTPEEVQTLTMAEIRDRIQALGGTLPTGSGEHSQTQAGHHGQGHHSE